MCSGIMQQQISLCGVYFESLFDYMEQRSSKERQGLLASSMGLLVKGRDLPIDMFFIPLQSRLQRPRWWLSIGHWLIPLSPLPYPLNPKRSFDGGKKHGSAYTPSGPSTLRPHTFFISPFYYAFPKGPSVYNIGVAQFCLSWARP